MIVFLTLLPPALEETALKVSLSLPALVGLSLSLTILDLPAGILPTALLALTPRPLTCSLTPLARALPEL